MEKGFERHHHLLGGGGGKMRGAAGLMGLQKQNSWSPDIERDEAWERRRRGLMRRAPSSSSLSRAQSVTDDDLDELRGCLDLGFGFELPACAACGEGRTRLVETLPALDLYYAVAVKGGGGGAGTEGQCAAPCTCGASSEASDPSPIGSPLSILSPDDPPETVKMRLKQWAQVVALSLRNRS
ncbi:uncharacterized protein LOC124688528 [Lolium rigidum]|uniref:uncharacterized protein LOC124688528 n=1 Tax=Lolium rigidum TaxID=89674 RepID=UPI001F5D8372|nr:uncharacterized protein LOC124688528 [Lolium rigidum]